MMLSAAALALAAPAVAAAPSTHSASHANPATHATPATPATVAVTPKVGDTVYDSTGIAAGTVESVSDTSFVLVTSAGKATVPLSGLSNGPKGPTIAMTKAQLEEAIRKAKG